MTQERDRAWRRSQRKKYIHRREPDIPVRVEPKPVRLYQLFTVEGDPLPVFAKVSDLKARDDEITIDLTHRQGCPEYGPYRHWDWDPEAQEATWVTVRPDKSAVCNCTGLKPSWGQWRKHSVVKAGMTWKFMKEYRPDHRPFPSGRLSKTPPAPGAHGKPHGSDKRWKMQAGRSSKVARAQQLGFDYPSESRSSIEPLLEP